MRLILTRHGQTEENKRGLIQGQIQGTLSEEGIEQAQKLARRLKEEKVECIVTSDLARAKDTAEEIAKYHEGVTIVVSEKLREGYCGSYELKPRSTIDWKNRPADVEPRESLRKRVKELVDEIYDQYPEGNVIFVGHNGINRALIALLLNKSVDYMDQVENPLNTGITIFKLREDSNHEIHLMNCVKHLDE